MSQPAEPLLPRRLLLPWLGFLVIALTVGVGVGAQSADYPTPFGIADCYRLLVGCQLFFVLVAVPLIEAGRGKGARAGWLELLLLLAMGAPAVVVAAWVAASGWPAAAASQAYLAAACILVLCYERADPDGRSRGWWWLVLGALGAGAPILAFLGEDLLRVRLTWLYAASPWWVADRLSRPWSFAWEWAVPFVLLLAVAAALSAWPPRKAAR